MGAQAILDDNIRNMPQSAHLLQVALHAIPVGIAWANLSDLKILFMNRKFTEMFGYRPEDFVDIREWIAKGYPFAEDRALARETWKAYFAAPDRFEVDIEPIEMRVVCKDGTLKTIIQSGVILPANGWALSVFVDITDRKRAEVLVQAAERQSRENQAIYRLLLDHSPEMIFLSPFDKSRRYVSPAVKRVTGFTAEEYLALRGLEMMHVDDRETAVRAAEAIRKGELSQVFRYRALHKDGSYSWVEANITGYLDESFDQTAGYVASIRDISRQKEQEERLASEYLQLSEVASLDELTGIANRRTFNQTLDREVLRNTRFSGNLSLLLIDVDYFKQYNDVYGHVSGDACLRRIAETIKRVLRRDSDLVARFGGEEFVVLLPMTDIQGATMIARAILRAISLLAVEHTGSPYHVVTASIGVACAPAGLPLNRALLLDQADRSLYQAKDLGRNMYRVYAQ
jgi:diguanylate cyclase (GGDEF)-like protein/PAS domain S-box-containing protein